MVADLFHYGHVEFLRMARDLGDYLLVGVHSDETVASYKRLPVMTMEERIRVVVACRYVDEVVSDAPMEITTEFLDRYAVDLVAHGDDFADETLERMYRVPLELGMLRTVPYTSGISTSEILSRVQRRNRG